MKYAVVTRLIPQQHIDGDWRVISTALLTDPQQDADWVRLHPLRISVLSDTNSKVGVAENPKEFRLLMEMLVGKARIPRKVGANQDGVFDTRRKPLAGTRDVTSLYQSDRDRKKQAPAVRRALDALKRRLGL